MSDELNRLRARVAELEIENTRLKCCGNCKWLSFEKDKDIWAMRWYCSRPTGGGGFEIDDRTILGPEFTCEHWRPGKRKTNET
jgi:hypothetical protein